MPPLPAPLQGKPPEEIERLYRAVMVRIWNRRVTMGRNSPAAYKALAEDLSVHVDTLRAAHEFIGEQQEAIAYALRQLLDPIPDLAPDYYAPVRPTAHLGSFTVNATITLETCPSEDSVPKALSAVKRLIDLLPPQASGLMVPRVKYKCMGLGTDGSLPFGFLWKRGDREPKQMEECSGTYPTSTPEQTRHWCESTWNNGRPLKE